MARNLPPMIPRPVTLNLGAILVTSLHLENNMRQILRHLSTKGIVASWFGCDSELGPQGEGGFGKNLVDI